MEAYEPSQFRVSGCHDWYCSDEVLWFSISCGFGSRDQLFGATSCSLLQISEKHVNLDASFPPRLHGSNSPNNEVWWSTSFRNVDVNSRIYAVSKCSWLSFPGPGYCETMRFLNTRWNTANRWHTFLIGIYAQPRTDRKLCIYGTYKNCNQFLHSSVCFSLLYTPTWLFLTFRI